MLIELTELCQELRNWFARDVHDGDYTISGGNITADFLQNGQYFRVIGSVFNDGVHCYPATDMISEEFTGTIWALAIPAPIIALAADIKAWRKKYETADSEAMSPFNSESFAGYSYSKGTGSGDGRVSSASWQDAFRVRMNAWRKL